MFFYKNPTIFADRRTESYKIMKSPMEIITQSSYLHRREDWTNTLNESNNISKQNKTNSDGGMTRTCDLQLMKLASYHCSTPLCYLPVFTDLQVAKI